MTRLAAPELTYSHSDVEQELFYVWQKRGGEWKLIVRQAQASKI